MEAAIDGATANPVSLHAMSESLSDVVGELRNILTGPRPRVIIPDLETPYSRRFPTNNNHDIELEYKSISAIIKERQQQLDAALHEISDLETVMDRMKNLHWQLIEKKYRITHSMNLHKRLVSAIWRFPTEVICNIFVHCLSGTCRNSPASMLAPMLLTRICRRWREIAVGMPSLWCTMGLNGNEINNRPWESIALCYDLWLKRSGGLPLSLGVWCHPDDPTAKLQSVIQPYISQISSLSIGTELVLEDLPALQELTIFARKHSKMTCIAKSISQLSSTLRSLKVPCAILNLEDFSPFTPVLAHLTNIEVAIHPLNVVPHLLHLCPNLSSLTIRASFSNQIQAFEPFTHTKLRSLRIGSDPCYKILYGFTSPHLPVAPSHDPTAHLSGLFNALSLPNLHVLEARYVSSHIWALFDDIPYIEPNYLQHCYIQSWPHAQMKALLQRSNCPLESLVFGPAVITTDEQRAEYVALIPSLKVVVSRASR